MTMAVIKPRTIYRKGRRAGMAAACIKARANRAYRLIHCNASRRRHLSPNLRRFSPLIVPNAQISSAPEQTHVGIDVSGDQTPLGIRKYVRVEFSRATHPTLALTPVVTDNRLPSS